MSVALLNAGLVEITDLAPRRDQLWAIVRPDIGDAVEQALKTSAASLPYEAGRLMQLMQKGFEE